MGARIFDNGYRAYVINGDVEVYNRSRIAIDMFLDDAYYFETSESFKKQKGSDIWGFYTGRGYLVQRAKDVKVLSKNMAAIQEIEGAWCIYRLIKNEFPEKIIQIKDANIEDIKCLNLSPKYLAFLLYSANGVEIVTKGEKGCDYVSRVKGGVIEVMNKNLVVVSTGAKAVYVVNSCGYHYACAGKNESLKIYNNEFQLIVDNASEVISFKNGTLAIKIDDCWKFCSVYGDCWGEVYDIDVCRSGVIMGKFHHREDDFSKIGRFDDEFIFLLQGEQTVVSDGKKTISVINTHFDDIAIIG